MLIVTVFILLIITMMYLLYAIQNQKISNNTLIIIILLFQTLIIFFQASISNEQKKYIRLQHLPQIIVYALEHREPSLPIIIKNNGETAYNLAYKMKLIERKAETERKFMLFKRHKIVKEKEKKDFIYILSRGEEKELTSITNVEAEKYEVIIDIIYEDIFKQVHEIRYLKLPRDNNFIMISTGIE